MFSWLTQSETPEYVCVFGCILPKKMRERSNCLVAVKAKNTEERANFEEQPRLLRPPLLMLPPPEPMAPIPLLAASACRSSDIAAKVPPEIIKALSAHQTYICLLFRAHWSRILEYLSMIWQTVWIGWFIVIFLIHGIKPKGCTNLLWRKALQIILFYALISKKDPSRNLWNLYKVTPNCGFLSFLDHFYWEQEDCSINILKDSLFFYRFFLKVFHKELLKEKIQKQHQEGLFWFIH